jgi:hypothetical protein
MLPKDKNVSMKASTMMLVVLANVLVVKAAFIYDTNWYAMLLITLPLLAGLINNFRRERQR